MNSFKLGIAALLLASATVSLTTAGTIHTDHGQTHSAPFAGSPRANALALDLKRTSGSRMDCCSAVPAKSYTVSPRAASAVPGQNASPVGMKCSMGHQAAMKTGCCTPAPAHKVACCG
jgi:hypothetical protein